MRQIIATDPGFGNHFSHKMHSTIKNIFLRPVLKYFDFLQPIMNPLQIYDQLNLRFVFATIFVPDFFLRPAKF